MATFHHDDIRNLDKIYRLNLINSCSGYKSANLIGTKSIEGHPNVAVFSSVTHLGSNPPLLGFILRPTTVPRHTYQNIKETGYFTINHIHEGILREAHHTSAKYDQHISEFDRTQLNSEYIDAFPAPFVSQASIKIGMRFVEEYHIKTNDTLHIIGEIQTLHVVDNLLESDGFINLSKGRIAAINGLDGYAIPRLKSRFGYQRPTRKTKL